jgi:putative PIN family toxin of toxin-antitoxin system
MGPPQAMSGVRASGTSKPSAERVVLDTNVVLSALVFTSGATARLRVAWQAARFVPLVSKATVEELVRVLAYPKLKLDAAEQEELLADYLPWTQVVAVPDPPPKVPKCRDRDDHMFLHLAAAGRASTLVTGDEDLLALSSPVKWQIVSPAGFLAKLA